MRLPSNSLNIHLSNLIMYPRPVSSIHTKAPVEESIKSPAQSTRRHLSGSLLTNSNNSSLSNSSARNPPRASRTIILHPPGFIKIPKATEEVRKLTTRSQMSILSSSTSHLGMGHRLSSHSTITHRPHHRHSIRERSHK